jgi:predicted glycosyltransferase
VRIWFDADNAPHVLVMRPIARELERRGHTVFFTARNRASTCELLDMYGIDYIRVGDEYGRSTLGKVIGTLKRALELRKSIRGRDIDVSFGHGSRSLPIASSALRIPSVTMYDYEWVNPSVFNRFCKAILLPDAISPDRSREAGISPDKVRFFPGFKENLYLSDAAPDPAIAAELGLREDRLKILLRPPATTAHYHNPEAEEILSVLLSRILQDPGIQLIWLSRTEEQKELVTGEHRAEVILPGKPYPGPQLILSSDMVMGGGGTMTREAAILGVRSLSFFRGKPGAVDRALSSLGRLGLMENSGQVDGIPLEPTGSSGLLPAPDDQLSVILGCITGE